MTCSLLSAQTACPEVSNIPIENLIPPPESLKGLKAFVLLLSYIYDILMTIHDHMTTMPNINLVIGEASNNLIS